MAMRVESKGKRAEVAGELKKVCRDIWKGPVVARNSPINGGVEGCEKQSKTVLNVGGVLWWRSKGFHEWVV